MALPKTIGRYEILSEVGRGSMGIVYKARDPRIGRIVALKTIAFSFPLGPGEEEEFLQRFYHEAQVAGRLNHPNIVTIYDVGEKGAEGDAYIAMEFVEGTNLQELLAGGGRLPLAQVADVIDKLAQALDSAHDAGVVHRDIKPANIVLTEAGQPKILDFGIARLAAGGLTRPGRFFGTPNYMSPEQVTGVEVDGRTDQFSLAVILYQLLTGEKPFAGESVTAISYQVVNVDPPPPSKLNPSLRASFDRILRKALAKNVSDRYPRCQDFSTDLKAAIAEWMTAAEKTPPTLVSGAKRPEQVTGPGSHGGVRGITFLAPRWSELLAKTGARFGLGWVAFLVCLALLAAAPFLMSRSPARRGPAAPPFAVLTTPFEGTVPRTPESPLVEEAARLKLSFAPRFDAVRIVVRLDGRAVVDEPFRRSAKGGAWRRTLPVVPGRHRVEVRIASADGSFDDVEGIEVDFRTREIRDLKVSAGGLPKKVRLRFEGTGEMAR
jgi:serine/threonine-protein kinase